MLSSKYNLFFGSLKESKTSKIFFFHPIFEGCDQKRCNIYASPAAGNNIDT